MDSAYVDSATSLKLKIKKCGFTTVLAENKKEQSDKFKSLGATSKKVLFTTMERDHKRIQT
jgi:hypothetical protein